MTTSFLGLPKPRLVWSPAGEPQDVASSDVYFSAEDGHAETEAVFLQGCKLPQRWADGRDHVIGELGFGTGLSFLTTINAWQTVCQPGQVLHYLAVEGAPMNADDMARAHLRFPALAKQAAELQTNWPAAIKGFHRRQFDNEVQLTLLFGPVAEMLAQLRIQANSWFLDGFAPAKNPDMWTDQVFALLAKNSGPAAHLASFSVAGVVRRGLSNVGFTVTKKPGYGRKRHRLEAQFLPKINARIHSQPPSVMIIGGGIAGACLAHGLSRVGIKPVIIDAKGLAKGASGNPCGLISPRLDLDDSPLSRFYRTAFAHAVDFYQQQTGAAFTKTGIMRTAQTEQQQHKFAALTQAQALPDNWMQAQAHGLLLPHAGILRPKAAIEILTNNIDLIESKLASLRYQDQQWVATDRDGTEICRAEIAILANGAGSIAGLDLPSLRLLRGQVSMASGIKGLPKMPVIGKSYAVTLGQDQLLFGATHDRVDQLGDQQVRPKDHLRNVAELQSLAPNLACQIDPDQLTGRTSYRAASPDLQPIAGPVPDNQACANWSRQVWGKLDDYASAPNRPGLYMLNGLGSRGLCLAPILAEAIIAMITDGPSPLEHDAVTALHPARFIARAARKQQT